MNFSKEPSPAFVLLNKHYEKLRNPIEIALYAHLSYLHEKQIVSNKPEMEEFCSTMNISADELNSAYHHLMDLGYLIKGN